MVALAVDVDEPDEAERDALVRHARALGHTAEAYSGHVHIQLHPKGMRHLWDPLVS
ncbi:unnamed protein product, partial [marine sediment metagenome]